MDCPFQPGPECCLLDDLIGSLLGDVTAFPGVEQVIVPCRAAVLSVKKNCAHEAILYEDDPLRATLAK